MQNPLKSLSFALEKYPERVSMIPLRELVLESARQNPKRTAYVKIAVPDEVVNGLKGRQDDQDLVLLVIVPKEVTERSESRLILPGEIR